MRNQVIPGKAGVLLSYPKTRTILLHCSLRDMWQWLKILLIVLLGFCLFVFKYSRWFQCAARTENHSPIHSSGSHPFFSIYLQSQFPWETQIYVYCILTYLTSTSESNNKHSEKYVILFYICSPNCLSQWIKITIHARSQPTFSIKSYTVNIWLYR